MEDTPTPSAAADDVRLGKEEDTIKRHPIYRFGFALVLGFSAGFGVIPTLMLALGLKPVNIDAYIPRSELDQNYVRKEELRTAKASLEELSKAHRILAATLQTEQSVRRAVEQDAAARVQACGSITQQIKELQATQTSVEDTIHRRDSTTVFWSSPKPESKERDALELENLQKRSARLQESLLELRRQLANCGTSGPASA